MREAIRAWALNNSRIYRVSEGPRGAVLVLPTPQDMFAWRRQALILFGAKVGKRVLIRSGVRVTYPWNLTMGDYVWVGDNVTLYSVAEISMGIAFRHFAGGLSLRGNA